MYVIESFVTFNRYPLTVIKMSKFIIYIFTIILLSSCSYYVYPPKVHTKHVYNYSFKNKINKGWEHSEWRKSKTLTEYIRYDISGNEIELGEYGEIWYFRKVTDNEDNTTSIVSGHGSHPKKLNTVNYKTFNDSNQVIQEIVWRFKDNKKNYLVYKILFEYSNNQLRKELEFDTNDSLIRTKNYDLEKNIESEIRKKSVYEPFVRIEVSSIDSITYDSLNREIEKIHYYKGKFLRRTVTIYNDAQNIVTIYLYDDEPNKLWGFTETKYDYFTKQPLRKYWKILNSTTETKDIYIYNRKKLLVKILHYNVDQEGRDVLEYYSKYKYKLY
jgi:hypothetical protein